MHVDQLMPLTDLHVTSAAGCRRCALILEAIQKGGVYKGKTSHDLGHPEQYVIGVSNNVQPSPWSNIPASDLTVVLYHRAHLTSFRLRLSRVECHLYTQSSKCQICDHMRLRAGTDANRDEVNTAAALDIPHATTVPAIASAESCGVQIKQWLDRCIEGHTYTCPAAVADLPSRVIAVGSRYQQPRLHETRLGDRGSYCALSYCWGKSVAFKTKIASYEDRKAGFDVDLLPQTIKHAVLLARELDIPYLWVDSICIIQDSGPDWEHEAARMCDVYSRAVVVFAAVDAPHCDTGLLYEDARRQHVKVGLDHEAVFVRQNFHNGITDRYHGSALYPLRPNALHHRGWTLQEVALASRIVWYV